MNFSTLVILHERNPDVPELCRRVAVWIPRRRVVPCSRPTERGASSPPPRTARRSPPPWSSAGWRSWTSSIAGKRVDPDVSSLEVGWSPNSRNCDFTILWKKSIKLLNKTTYESEEEQKFTKTGIIIHNLSWGVNSSTSKARNRSDWWVLGNQIWPIPNTVYSKRNRVPLSRRGRTCRWCGRLCWPRWGRWGWSSRTKGRCKSEGEVND